MSDGYRCADAADRRHEPLLATASQVRAWVLVEVRGAWGVDAVHDSALAGHVPRDWRDRHKRHQARVVCIRSHLRTDQPGTRLFACAARRPGGGLAPLRTHEVDSLADIVPTVDQLAKHGEEAIGWERVDEPLVLVCTNGRHDQCCANRGRPLVRTLRESRWADRVWECSHIGGDRFAANVVVLPDSLYFGRVEPDSAVALLEGLDAGRVDLSSYRGRSSLTLAEQAVEHFVRRERDIHGIDAIEFHGRDDDAFVVRVGQQLIRVRVKRHMVSVAEPLTCHGRPHQLVPSFELISIR